MTLLSEFDPTGRFTGLAGYYEKHRPSYPAEAVDYILNRCGLIANSVLIDVGCGTGISSRLFACRGLRVIGIEPNADMRRSAELEAIPPGFAAPVYRNGHAEATGLADASADAVLAAQAFHWFEPEPTLQEFHRILRPGGWAALLSNDRDEADPFTAAFAALLRTTTEGRQFERPSSRTGEPLLTSPLFESGERRQFPSGQRLDEEGLLGRTLSMSYAPRTLEFLAALRQLHAQFQSQGHVTMCYQTRVMAARRR